MIDDNEYIATCTEYLQQRVTFLQRNSDALLARIARASISGKYAKDNPGFRLKRTARSKGAYWCCYAGPNVPIYDFMDGTVRLTTDDKCFVMSGSRDEKYLISALELVKRYSLGQGSLITPASLRRFARGQWFKVYPVLSDDDNLALSISTIWAIAVPAELQFSVKVSDFDTRMGNMPGLEHANGDLLLVGDTNGRPDFRRLGLVNGGVFADCFHKMNFPNYLPYFRQRVAREPEQLLLDRV